jgi:teichuronic acid biosynthesis glycosyltransferase TuaC
MHSALNEHHFDVIHAHYGFTGIVAAAQKSVPVIVTFHGSDVLGRSFEGPYRRAFGIVEAWLSKRLARNIAHAVVVSRAMAARLGAPRVTVAQMGIDLTRFRPVSRGTARAALGLDPTKPIVIFVGDPRLPRKRFSVAAAAVEVARRYVPTAELLPIYGRDHDEVALYMNAADALILTSYVEGSPTVVKEAMACDLPVISVPVGDVEEQLRGVRPSYMRDAEPAALGLALADLLAAPRRSNGRAMVERFTNERVASVIAELYTHVTVNNVRK